MFRYEWPVLLGHGFVVFVWPKKNRFIRYLAIYGWGSSRGLQHRLLQDSLVHHHDLSGRSFSSSGNSSWISRIKIGNRVCALSPCAPAGRLAGMVGTFEFLSTTPTNKSLMSMSRRSRTSTSSPVPLFKLVARDPANYHMKGLIVALELSPAAMGAR